MRGLKRKSGVDIIKNVYQELNIIDSWTAFVLTRCSYYSAKGTQKLQIKGMTDLECI